MKRLSESVPTWGILFLNGMMNSGEEMVDRKIWLRERGIGKSDSQSIRSWAEGFVSVPDTKHTAYHSRKNPGIGRFGDSSRYPIAGRIVGPSFVNRRFRTPGS